MSTRSMWCLWLVALVTLAGCGTTASLRDWDSTYIQEHGGVFLPEAWADAIAEHEALVGVCSSDEGSRCEPADESKEPAAGRRPSRRRAGGEPGRRPPPLLNPRPSPEEIQARARRAADHAVVLQARQLYQQRLAEALAKYPNSSGFENHHFTPMYLGGPPNGQTYRLPTAYHKLVTQAFRERWAYGRRRPNPDEFMEVLLHVYSRYPIPQLIGIEP